MALVVKDKKFSVLQFREKKKKKVRWEFISPYPYEIHEPRYQTNLDEIIE